MFLAEFNASTSLDGKRALLYCVLVVVGSVIGWLLKAYKTGLEIGKLKVQITSLSGELLEKVQGARLEYTLAITTCNEAVRRLINAINTGQELETVRHERETVCRALLDESIPKYLVYTEMNALQLIDSKDELYDFIIEDVISELRLFCDTLAVLNKPEIVDPLNQANAFISKFTIKPFSKLTKKLNSSDKDFADERLREVIDKILAYQ